MGKRRLAYVLALLGCTGFYIAYREWLAWLLLVGLLGLPWLSLLVSLPLLLTLRVKLAASGPVPVGTGVSVRVLGAARPLVPEFSCRLGLTRPLTGEHWQGKNGAELRSDHCGGILVEPEKLYAYDLLGLFCFPVKPPAGVWVIFRPRPVAMDALPELERYLARAWKPKPGRLTVREPMEPLRGRVLLTLDIRGTAEELDRKFGRLLWLGSRLLEKGLKFEIMALTAQGIVTLPVEREEMLTEALDRLLCAGPAPAGSVLDRVLNASWHRHLGGEPDAP